MMGYLKGRTTCRSCEAKIPGNAAFCQECGVRVPAITESASAPSLSWIPVLLLVALVVIGTYLGYSLGRAAGVKSGFKAGSDAGRTGAVADSRAARKAYEAKGWLRGYSVGTTLAQKAWNDGVMRGQDIGPPRRVELPNGGSVMGYADPANPVEYGQNFWFKRMTSTWQDWGRLHPEDLDSASKTQ